MPEGEYLQFGGQAVVEGVMMRSPNHFAVAVLAPNKEIVVQQESLSKSWIAKQKWLKFPFVRGSFALIDSMALGIRAMRFASEVQLDDKYQPVAEGEDPTLKAASSGGAGSKTIQDLAIGGTMVISLLMGLVLFVYLPNLIGEKITPGGDAMMKNLVSGVVKAVIFFGYILLIAQMASIKRVFQFHGAEHKAINCMEAGKELTVENCMPITRLHPRCGTSFAVVVLLIGIVVFVFVPRYPVPGVTNLFLSMLVRVAIELPFLFLISGTAYELIRLAGKFRNTLWVNMLFWPGLMTQYITTIEPDEEQMKVAIRSLEAVIEAEEETKLAKESQAAAS